MAANLRRAASWSKTGAKGRQLSLNFARRTLQRAALFAKKYRFLGQKHLFKGAKRRFLTANRIFYAEKFRPQPFFPTFEIVTAGRRKEPPHEKRRGSPPRAANLRGTHLYIAQDTPHTARHAALYIGKERKQSGDPRGKPYNAKAIPCVIYDLTRHR